MAVHPAQSISMGTPYKLVAMSQETETETETSAETTEHEYSDTEFHYENVLVRGFEEIRTGDGSLSQVKLTVSAELVEPLSDGDIAKLSEERFELTASGINTEGKKVRLSKFKPLRSEEYAGLYVHELEVLWEALADLEDRGYTVDTGTLGRDEGVGA